MSVCWYVKNACVFWHGSELVIIINLTWCNYSTQPLDTLEPCHPLDTVAPDMPSPTCPCPPFLLVCSVTNGLTALPPTSPKTHTHPKKAAGPKPDHLGHWKLILSWIPEELWPTHRHASSMRGGHVHIIQYILPWWSLMPQWGQLCVQIHTHAQIDRYI